MMDFGNEIMLMVRSEPSEPQLLSAARQYWRDIASRSGPFAATGALIAALWEFLRDSTPSRLRQRFGDADYDWDYRVNTTSGAVGWRDRLLGVLYSPYQPTEPALFHEILSELSQQTKLNFADFTFLDLGSGKGRTLLMASDYPFQRIVGVELLPALNRIAVENLALYEAQSQKCFALESICADGSTFPLPDDPLVIYLFNPFSESVLSKALENISQSLFNNPRPVYLLYHNPQLERLLIDRPELKKITGSHQYSIFSASI